ncbi:MAG: biotin--[acetyl-CoA-carboxylase] ligase, partial [Synergistaceae bacterium]|nr:biotin--[acetyl-CoA-carboxylase] ligase [Synergistaceae bacterium]
MVTGERQRINWLETKNFLRDGVRLGGTVHSAGVMASTQTPAKDAARAGAAHGTVFVTDFQSSGRGRRDREWTTAPGIDLTFSVILRPGIDAGHAHLLNMAASLAVSQALEKIFGGVPGSRRNPIGIKWPNDVMAGGKKICGILCETACEGERIDYAVLGVGVNVNGSSCDMP